ncbi:MAG TPA: glycerate kinase, partial [Anaerovoracaceae bacterium]|nr:glycerate kinase [Anaerovoracaceae bacterium]
IKQSLDVDVPDLKGGGAAGAMGAGVYAFLGGKVVVGIGRRALKKNVPVIAVVGFAEDGLAEIYQQGITRVFPATNTKMPWEVLKLRCKDDLTITMNQVIAAIKRDEVNLK